MNTEHTNQSTSPEPFGYFKAEPFGWTDCEESDEGAIALYDRPQAEPVNQQLLDALGKISRMTMSMYTSAGEAMSDAKRIAHEAIAAAEQAQQAEPVAKAGFDAWFAAQQFEIPKLYWNEIVSMLKDAYCAAPPAVAVPDENAAFVEWAKEFGYPLETVNSERHSSDPYYTNQYTRLHWEAWKARAMLAAAPQAAVPVCQACNGKGMVGGLLPNGGGYDGEPCPDCSAPQATAEDSSVVQADAPAPATEYSWSNNGEEYHGRFSSVAEAVCDYLDSEGDGAGEVVHVGEVKPHEPGNPIWLADNVLETLGEQAHGDVGEYVGDWPELPPEKREQLGKMIQDFVWTHDAPSFFSIGKSELVEVAAYRDDAAGQKGGA